MSEKTFSKWSAYALILWALHLLVRDGIFAFTHGTTESPMDRTLLGLYASQYSSLWTAFAGLGIIGVAGVYVQASPRLSWLGKAGFIVALLGLGLSFVAAVMQNWILDWETNFHSPLVYGGWLLSIAAVFVVTAGLVLAGIDVQRATALPRGSPLILIIGIISLPTALLHSFVVGNSDGSLATQLIYGSLSVPYALCWLRLGFLRLATRGLPANKSMSRPTGTSG